MITVSMVIRVGNTCHRGIVGISYSIAPEARKLKGNTRKRFMTFVMTKRVT